MAARGCGAAGASSVPRCGRARRRLRSRGVKAGVRLHRIPRSSLRSAWWPYDRPISLSEISAMQTFFVSSVATTEILEGSYRANDGNDVLDDLGRKSPRRTQFPLTEDPSEPTSPARAQLAFA